MKTWLEQAESRTRRQSVSLQWVMSLLLLFVSPAASLASSPILSNVLPRGGQLGTTVEVLLVGDRLGDAAEVLFYEPGLAASSLTVVSEQQVKVSVAIAADCLPGTKHLRLRTKSGLSDLRTFLVSPYPTVAEVEPNNEFTAPQVVAMNSTAEGIIQNEDVDYFVVEAKQGERLTAEVEGIRLGNTLFDVYVAILNEARFELASSDDAALVAQDGIASIVVPTDGKYIVQIRESSYRGDGNSHYRCHIGRFPRPLAVIPAGGLPGETLEVTFLGDAAGPFKQTVTLPLQADPDYQLFAMDAQGISPSGNRFRVVDLPGVTEVEPNASIAQATKSSSPVAFSGYVDAPEDQDWFGFQATKGQSFDVNVYARRLRSELDPVLTITNAAGAGLTSNDDQAGPDSVVRFTAPEDGEYFLNVRDHLGRGGPAYHYRIEVAPVVASLGLTVNEFVQYIEPKLVIPQGNRIAILVGANRRDFGGPLEFLADRLPAGVTMETFGMAANQNVAQVLLVAAPDAPPAGVIGSILGRLVDPNNPVPPVANVRQDVVLVRGQNQIPFWSELVPGLAVAVSEKIPFRLEIVEPKAPLVQSGSMRLKVLAHREPGFIAPIKIELVLNPNGLNSSRETSIPEGQSEAFIDINSAGNAELGLHKLAVRGDATVGNGPVSVASPFITLKVAEPYVRLAFQTAAVEQGASTELVVAVEVAQPFEGVAPVTLYGLPNKVTTKPLELTKELKELIYPIAAEMDAPVSQNKDLFCQVIVTVEGEPVVHNIGSGQLRVDQPLPPKVAVVAPPEPMPAPAPMPVEAAPPKRLTRLEQLRLDQQQRLKEAAAAAGTP